MRQAEIAALLPGVFRRAVAPDNVLGTILAVMEAMQAPSEEILEELDSYFDPYRAPENAIPFLAGWVDLDRLFAELPDELDAGSLCTLYPAGIGRLRELVVSAAELSRRRGTAAGLVRFLETATGVSGFFIEEQVADEAGNVRPFHFQVRAPAAAGRFDLLIRRIVELEKPAYVTWKLIYDDR